MENSIKAIVDVSGGMNEFGKLFILKNLCRYLKMSEHKVTLYFLNNQLTEITQPQKINPSNIANLEILSKEIEKWKEAETNILIISDGNLQILHVKDFYNKIRKFENVKIRTVAVGPDLKKNNLKKLSTNDTFYLAEDIQSAMNSLLLFMNNKTQTPSNLNEI
jgi:adenylosuccinate synthase